MAPFKIDNTYKDTDSDKDMDTDTEIDSDMDLEIAGIRTWTHNWWSFAKDPYGTIQYLMDHLLYDKPQWSYALVAPLPDENGHMQIIRSSYRHWDCSLNDMFKEWEYQD